MDMSKGLSIRAYADHRKARDLPGGSKWSVTKAIRDGRITRNQHGKIDPAAADRQWDQNTDQAQVRDHKAMSNNAKQRLRSQEQSGPSRPGIPSYQESRAIREAYRARLTKLEYEEQAGKLLRADEVEEVWTRFILCCRARLLAMPHALSLQVAAESDVFKVQELMRVAVYEALEELSRYGQQGPREEE